MKEKLLKSFISPLLNLKKRYVPLLLIYFAYGAQGLTSVTMTFWEKENLSLSTEQFIIISTWLTLPWTLKMIFGQLVDNVKIAGSRRRIYVYLGALLMALGYLILFGLMVKTPWLMNLANEFTLYLASSLLSVFGFVLQDVAADTMSTEVADRSQPEKKVRQELAMIQILGRLSLMIGGVLAAAITGYLASTFQENPQTVVLIALILPVLSVLGAMVVKLDVSEINEIRFSPLILGGGIFYAIFMLFMAFLGSFSAITQALPWLVQFNQEIVFAVSLVLLSTMIWWLIKNESKDRIKVIIFVFLAIFIFRAMPSTGPGFSWWAIDVLGFDREFFGLIKFISSIVPLLLLWFAAEFIAKAPVRWVLLWLVVVGTILSLPELGLFYGIHEQLGLSSRFVVIADTVFDSPLVHISMIPMLALIAYFAPEHSKATWFAVMASMMNLALTATQLGTKYLNQVFVVSREILNEAGEVLTPMNYAALGDLLTTKIIISFVIPLVVLLLIWNRIKV